MTTILGLTCISEELKEKDKKKFAKPCEDYDKGEVITTEELDDILKDLE